MARSRPSTRLADERATHLERFQSSQGVQTVQASASRHQVQARSRVFGAITLDETGGGVDTASRLMWQAITDTWGSGALLLSLGTGTNGHTARPPGIEARVRFGAKVAYAQTIGAGEWTFFSHLAVAQVQTFVPLGYRRRYGVFLHGIEVWRPLTPRQTAVLRNAALLVANSEFTARRTAALHPWMTSIAVCPLALPGTSAAALRVASAGARPPVVIIVGRLDPGERYKGHDELIVAWRDVRARVPGARLLVVGGGADGDRLRALAKEHGVADAVEFTGFVSQDQLHALYEQARVFAMPSRNEGFGLVYLEAMRHHLPCVGSVHDAARDVIADAVTGCLIDQGNRTQLTSTLVRLLLDDEACRRMGEAGFVRATQQFSYSAFRQRFVELLRGTLEVHDRLARPLPSAEVQTASHDN